MPTELMEQENPHTRTNKGPMLGQGYYRKYKLIVLDKNACIYSFFFFLTWEWPNLTSCCERMGVAPHNGPTEDEALLCLTCT